MQGIGGRPRLVVTADGAGIVSHAGTALLGGLVERVGLTGWVDEELAVLGGVRKRGGGHPPGRVLADLAVMIADGGEAIADIAVLGDQPGLHGPVASPATAWRVLKAVADRGQDGLDALARGRAQARERAWLARAELTGRAVPPARAAGVDLDYLVIDLDATVVVCHSEKEQATPTFKMTFGYHPLLAFLDNTNEALAGLLRPGRAGSNTAADHITVLDAARAQIPDAHRADPTLVRCDGAGFSHAFLDHLAGLGLQYSVGWTMSEPLRDGIRALPRAAWTSAVTTGNEPRDGADVAELTAMLPATHLAGWPPGLRLIVRRERPHPGAQLDALEERDGFRYQVFATNTAIGQLAFLDARHRAHARVEDRIRTGKDTGIGRFPSRSFAINAVWLSTALTAIDLLAYTQTALLHDMPALARAEPKALRYRLLHTAARIVTGGRKLRLRLDRTWPWATHLTKAFTRLHAIPAPT